MRRVEVPSGQRGATPITLNYTMVKVFFARRITKVLSVVHNCNYLLALLLICSLRTSICVCKYLYMLSGTNSDFCHFPWPGPMTLTFPSPSPGPQPLSAALTFYILSAEMVISLRLLVIPVFHYKSPGPILIIVNLDINKPSYDSQLLCS